jgi:hypothetical protein
MDNEKKYIFDNPDNVKRVLYILAACCVLLFALDFVIHRHVMHSWENLWGFYPVYGFVGCVILVLVAKWMRTFLMRAEDYYDEGDAEINEKPDSNEKHSAASGDNDVDA